MSNDREIRIRVKAAAAQARGAMDDLLPSGARPNTAFSGKSDVAVLRAIETFAEAMESAVRGLKQATDSGAARTDSAEPAAGGTAAAGADGPGGVINGSGPPGDGWPSARPQAGTADGAAEAFTRPADSGIAGADGGADFQSLPEAQRNLAGAQADFGREFLAAARAQEANLRQLVEFLREQEPAAGDAGRRLRELLDRILRLVEISPGILDRLNALEQRLGNQGQSDHALGASG